jgi:hypothetical protein
MSVLLLHREIGHPLHAFHDGAHLLGKTAKLVEVVPKDLDRDIGAGSREHVIKCGARSAGQ